MSESSVLIAAWYFPPDGGAGSQRPASFARHLPGLGWDCRVVSRSESNSRGRWNRFDQSLMSQLSESSELIRVEESGPFSESKFPGERTVKAQIGPFCRRVLEEVSLTSPDILLLTMSPFILSEVLAMMPQDSHTKVIVDLRDPWILDYWTIQSSRGIRRKQHHLMHRMLGLADGIVMNTPEATSQCLEEFGSHLASKMLTLENGFEADHFSKSKTPASSQIRIMHTGTFHCESLHPPPGLRARLGSLRHASRGKIDRTGRTPYHLFRAAQILRTENPELASRLRFDFAGDIDPGLSACVQTGGFSSQTTLHGYVDHDQMTELITHASALFLPGGKLSDDVRDPITPGKTYEYLASGRPIIAALNPGSGLDLVSSCPGVFACDPCSPRAIAEAINEVVVFHDTLGDRDLIEERRSLLIPYLRSSLAGRLSDFMKQIVHSNRGESGRSE
jgi:glycosyltransferase involved in cell wall biosynthesis